MCWALGLLGVSLEEEVVRCGWWLTVRRALGHFRHHAVGERADGHCMICGLPVY